MTRPTVAARRPNPRASLAALLSFLFPGLGQAYNGQILLAWLLAAPVVVVLLGAFLAIVLARTDVLARLLDARFLVGLIVLDLALLGWRLVAITQAHSDREPMSAGRWTAYLTGGLLVFTLFTHALPAWYAVKAIDTLAAVAREGSGVDAGEGDGETSSPLPEPSDQPQVGAGERVNILLVGVDSSQFRVHELTDTMLVVSLDPDTGRSVMLSIPRDLYGVPLPDGRVYNDKLNSLMSISASRPDELPPGGVGTLKATVGELLGVPIHYFAAINMFGFKDAVDAIGGVEVNVERAVNDPHYFNEFEQQTGFYIQPGRHYMDGSTALAYVRSRLGEGDSDFTRAERQQQLLAAVREKLTAGNLVLALPGLLDAVKSTIVTDIPSARLPELAAAVQEADMSALDRVVLAPPEYVTPEPFSAAGYILHPNLPAIRELSDDVFADEPSAAAN